MNLMSLQDYKEANEIDLIDSAFNTLEATYGVDADTIATFKDKPSKAIWAMYRYQLLNCCGCGVYIDRWKYRFADRAYNLMERYDLLFKAYEKLKTDGVLGNTSSVTKVTSTNEGTSSATMKDNSVATNENIPQYAKAEDGTWINNRAKNDSENESSGTTANNGTIETDSALGLLPAELADKMRKALFNPYTEYAREFEDLFVPFYASGCRC